MPHDRATGAVPARRTRGGGLSPGGFNHFVSTAGGISDGSAPYSSSVGVQRLEGGDDGLVIRLFGSLTVEDGKRVLGAKDLGGTRPKQVLEILVAARGHRVPTDRLAEVLWGAERPQNAAGSLQTFVSVLRRRLVTDRERARRLVVTEAEAYRFATELVALDLDRFDDLVDGSAREPTHLARRSLEQALALVRGEVLEDEPYAGWAQDLRGTYQGRVLGAHLEAADAALAELDFDAALIHAEAATALDTYGERAHRTAMLALYALGRQHEALAAHRGFRARLDEELGLGPTAETRALETAILRQDDVGPLLPRPIRREQGNGGSGSVRLLGRKAELELLEYSVREALEGSFALLMVEGEAGLGKTRLLDELSATLVGVRIGRTECSELERHLPYVPVAAALREALAGTPPEDRPALGQILPELDAGDARHFTELDALEALVALVTEHAPLVLLLDDFEHADSATLAALRYLQRRCHGIAAAVVVAVRTGEAPRDHPVRRLTPDTLVRLGPLTAEEIAPLGVPHLHASTGGHPRFVTEAIAGRTRSELSAALSEALLAECREEGARAYRVLVAASVLQQPFEPEPLATLTGVDVIELVEELERLCERRILRIDGFRFRFRYDLVREVLLASLSPARLRLLQANLDRTPAAVAAAGTSEPAWSW